MRYLERRGGWEPKRPTERTRNRPTFRFRCLAETRAREFERSDEGIVQENQNQLLVWLDFTELDYVGDNHIFNDGEVIGKQDEYRASLYIDQTNGKILAAGLHAQLDPEIIYDDNSIELNLRVYLEDDQHSSAGSDDQGYFFGVDEFVDSQGLELKQLLYPRALNNLQATLEACNNQQRV